jgi:hypothetical protein
MKMDILNGTRKVYKMQEKRAIEQKNIKHSALLIEQYHRA